MCQLTCIGTCCSSLTPWQPQPQSGWCTASLGGRVQCIKTQNPNGLNTIKKKNKTFKHAGCTSARTPLCYPPSHHRSLGQAITLALAAAPSQPAKNWGGCMQPSPEGLTQGTSPAKHPPCRVPWPLPSTASAVSAGVNPSGSGTHPTSKRSHCPESAFLANRITRTPESILNLVRNSKGHLAL